MVLGYAFTAALAFGFVGLSAFLEVVDVRAVAVGFGAATTTSYDHNGT
jgi:hypothetical protein